MSAPLAHAALNSEQLEAVEHGAGPLLVLAGAGSGKTRVLTHRIAHLIRERGVPPHAILAVTFTNKAAQEMRDRVAQLLGRDVGRLWIGTFHSIGLRLLRIHGERLGYQSGLSVYDTDDQRALIARILKEGGAGEPARQAREMQGRISRAKNALQTPEDLAAHDPRLAQLAHVWGKYQEELRRQNAVDFDDILLQSLALLQENDDLLEKYRRRFAHILVDEYQDTNAVQFRLIATLAGPSGNVCAVGDDDQSIYGWRGADVRNILDFESAFPGVKTVRLEENYRSSAAILDVAHAVVSRNQGRKPKRLWTRRAGGERVRFALARDEDEEARLIVAEISRALDAGDAAPGEMVILYRTHAQSRPLEDACLARRVPYTVVGAVTFYQRREIKDLLAYMRLALNPRDMLSLRRAVSVPRRGVGEKTLEEWLHAAQHAGRDPVALAADTPSG
ncbi:MAG: AAA family ATPase, partial [Candidatus Eisenbacteria bacterium]|nr:AAA family ATPase [Candidatus Eisenbacteria bacterium]